MPEKKDTKGVFNVVRNYSNVQYEAVRSIVDNKFTTEHDSLSDIYYNHWKGGDYSAAYRGHKPDVGASKHEAKTLFDKLHGLIFHKYELALYEENELQGNPYPKLKEKMETPIIKRESNKVFDINTIKDVKGVRKDRIGEFVQKLEKEGISLEL